MASNVLKTLKTFYVTLVMVPSKITKGNLGDKTVYPYGSIVFFISDLFQNQVLNRIIIKHD